MPLNDPKLEIPERGGMCHYPELLQYVTYSLWFLLMNYDEMGKAIGKSSLA